MEEVEEIALTISPCLRASVVNRVEANSSRPVSVQFHLPHGKRITIAKGRWHCLQAEQARSRADHASADGMASEPRLYIYC